jgi:hypothetical protein
MSEHIDVDVTGVLTREMTIDEAGDALIEMIVRTANGRATAAEALGHREFSMTKLYRSARSPNSWTRRRLAASSRHTIRSTTRRFSIMTSARA